jgi:hypothetical protein
VDGLIYASSMVMLDSARRKTPVPALARWPLGLGIAATVAANFTHGLGHGLADGAVAAWPAVALVGPPDTTASVPTRQIDHFTVTWQHNGRDARGG